MSGFERRVPHRLSLGQRKRVALATVLTMDPSVLVFDEPSAGVVFDYEGWWGNKSLPELREDAGGIVAGPKAYIYAATERWMNPKGKGTSHGIDGWRTAYPEVYHVPKIAGQQPAYLLAALKAYKTGDRTHPSMVAIAASLSDQDMANLAAYYAQSGLATAGKR